MAKQQISENLKKKALEYRSLTFEKYSQTIEELESRKQALIRQGDSKSQVEEIQACNKMISAFKADTENIKSISEEMFVGVVLDKGLLINVIMASEQEKRKGEQKGPMDKLRVSMQRKKELSSKSIEELLDIVMECERLKIENLKLQTKKNNESAMSGALSVEA